MPQLPVLSDPEFETLRKFLYDAVGINLTPEKKALVTGRLSKRIVTLGLNSFGEYFRRIAGPDLEERQWAFNALSTNETSFFREPAHFRFLAEEILPRRRPGQTFRVWSAASSSGEEAYSIAMVLSERLGNSGWEIVGSDLSTKVLDLARRGLYPMERAKTIPKPYLRDYCLKGTGAHEGAFMIDARLRNRINFLQANLLGPLPQVGMFDLIFLRNVLIYFDPPTKRKVVDNLLPFLNPGGHFFSGHSESLTGMVEGLENVQPAIYRKPA